MGSGSIGIVVGQLAKDESAVAQDSVYACSFSTSLQKGSYNGVLNLV